MPGDLLLSSPDSVNGIGVIGLKLHPFIITLGTMGIFRGIAFVTTKAQSIGNFHPAFVDGFISRKAGADFAAAANVFYPIPLCILDCGRRVGQPLSVSRTVTGAQAACDWRQRNGGPLCRAAGGRWLKATTYVYGRTDGGDRRDDQYRLSRLGGVG